MTLGVAIIARNAQDTIGKCIKSFEKHVDEIAVVLAGESTDDTAKAAKKASKKVKLYAFKWVDDFAAARNFSLSKLNTDWMLWVDADDEIKGAENLKKICEKIDPKVACVWFPYEYAFDEFGNLTTLYERERLLRTKNGWVWRSRLHETVSPMIEGEFVRSDDVIIKHNHSGESRNDRNFKHLDLMYKEDPEDRRVWLYFGHQFFAARNFQKSAEWYLKFGTDNQVLPIEKYQALCYASKSLLELNDHEQATDVALSAVNLYPQYIDAYLDLARGKCVGGDYDTAIHWALLTDHKELIQEPPHVIFINPLDYQFNKLAILMECYLKKGDFQKALFYAVEMNKVRPTLKSEIDNLRTVLRREDVIRSVKALAVELLKNNEIVKLNTLLSSVPYWFTEHPEFQSLLGGTKHHTRLLKELPKVPESNDLGECQDIQALLEREEKKELVSVFCSMPGKIRTLSLKDLENIVVQKPGRHILNLRYEPGKAVLEYDLKVPNFFIRMFVGRGLEYWSPQTIKSQGCGGSETSAALVCKEWAKRGAQPFLYAMDTQVWDGVIYRTAFTPETPPCQVFISSRVPEVLGDSIPCDQKWLWLHDTDVGDRLRPEICEKIDAIICLSKWHVGHIKRCYPFLKDCEVIDYDENPLTYEDDYTRGVFHKDAKLKKLPKIAIIGDGIDTSRFEGLDFTKEKNSFVWISSPDRGLEELLTQWKNIKEKLPDATLKIYYGWNYFDKALGIPGMREYKNRIIELLKQDGVEWVGRVGQDELAKILAKTEYYIYPPHPFRETYGIAFVECQMAKVKVLYRMNGALGETIGDRGIPIPMDAQDISSFIKDIDTQKGYDYALTRDWKYQVEKMEKLYWRLV